MMRLPVHRQNVHDKTELPEYHHNDNDVQSKNNEIEGAAGRAKKNADEHLARGNASKNKISSNPSSTCSPQPQFISFPSRPRHPN